METGLLSPGLRAIREATWLCPCTLSKVGQVLNQSGLSQLGEGTHSYQTPGPGLLLLFCVLLNGSLEPGAVGLLVRDRVDWT
jgi:hypothetical protein